MLCMIKFPVIQKLLSIFTSKPMSNRHTLFMLIAHWFFYYETIIKFETNLKASFEKSYRDFFNGAIMI